MGYGDDPVGHPEHVEFQYDHVRRVLLACAAVSLLSIPGDLIYPGGRAAVLWRVTWIFALVGASLLQRPGRLRAARLGLHAAGLTSGVAAGAIVLLTGSSFGPRFGFLLAIGPTALLLVPDQPWTALLAGAASIGFAVRAMLQDGRAAGFIVEWLGLAWVITFLAAWGARWFRRVWIGQITAQRERALALERLALSERRRVEAERLASIGRIAGEVAHGISNPLAVVKANLRWLEAERPRTEGDDVFADTEEGLRRIARIVDDVRALASEGSGAAAFDAASLLTTARNLVGERAPGAQIVLDLGAALPPATGSPERLARALSHLAAHLLVGQPAPGRVALGVRREGPELAFLVRAQPGARASRLAGSLDWSLASELAAQGNGTLDALGAEGAEGFVLRVPAVAPAHMTPEPLPAVSLPSGMG